MKFILVEDWLDSIKQKYGTDDVIELINDPNIDKDELEDLMRKSIRAEYANKRYEQPKKEKILDFKDWCIRYYGTDPDTVEDDEEWGFYWEEWNAYKYSHGIREGFEEFAYNNRADYDRLNSDDDYYNALWNQYENELELKREREEYNEV